MRLSLRVLVAEAAPDGIWLGSSVLIFEQVQADQRPAAQVLDNNLHTAESYLSHRDPSCSTVLRIFEFLDARHAAGSHIDCHMGASLRRLPCNSAAESENFLQTQRGQTVAATGTLRPSERAGKTAGGHVGVSLLRSSGMALLGGVQAPSSPCESSNGAFRDLPEVRDVTWCEPHVSAALSRLHTTSGHRRPGRC